MIPKKYKSLSKNKKRLQAEYRALERKEHYLRTLHQFTSSLLAQNTIEAILWDIAKTAIGRMGFVDCVVYLLDEEAQHLVQKAAHGPKNPEDLTIKNPIIIPLGKGIVGTVAQTGIPEIIGDTSIDSRYIIDDQMRLSEIAVPLCVEGKIVGVIDSEHPQKDFYTEEHLELLTTISAMAATKILQLKAQEKLKAQQIALEKEVSLRTEELEEVVRELKRSNFDLEQFAYAISHDLQEPIRMIISYLQLLERTEKRISPEGKEFMDFAVDGAKRMRQILKDLLKYARINKTQVLKPVELGEVWEAVVANLALTIRQKKGKIIVEQRLPTVHGIEVLLLQLLQNLLANALKFSRPNVPVVVTIRFEKIDAFYRFEFSDNGIGIDEAYYEKVFGLFRKLHARDEYEGSGIGLALCKRILAKHGGEIWVIQSSEQGTTFCFTLPIAKASEE
ncbi:MAG: sensor histidine kinase [Chitinophagales bacterium]